MKILFVCTGNSCRSPMAEGILKNIDPSVNVRSAGANPEKEVSIYAVAVMKEVGIDISKHMPMDLKQLKNGKFDIIITLSDKALDTAGNAENISGRRIHIRFDDPTLVKGSSAKKMEAYRQVRNEIKSALELFWKIWRGGKIMGE